MRLGAATKVAPRVTPMVIRKTRIVDRPWWITIWIRSMSVVARLMRSPLPTVSTADRGRWTIESTKSSRSRARTVSPRILARISAHQARMRFATTNMTVRRESRRIHVPPIPVWMPSMMSLMTQGRATETSAVANWRRRARATPPTRACRSPMRRRHVRAAGAMGSLRLIRLPLVGRGSYGRRASSPVHQRRWGRLCRG